MTALAECEEAFADPVAQRLAQCRPLLQTVQDTLDWFQEHDYLQGARP